MQIRRLEEADRAEWERLYEGYAQFYRVVQTAEMRDRVWGWIMDADHETEALVAVNAKNHLLGMAHFRNFARPLSATVGGFLDDLFVFPEARGLGAADALISALREEGQKRGWSVIRWITDENNYRARGLYDRLAQSTKWVTYDLKP